MTVDAQAASRAIERDVTAIRGKLDYPGRTKAFPYLDAVEALDRIAALAHRAARLEAAETALDAIGRECERASDVRANRTGIIGNVHLIVQGAHRRSEGQG